MKFPPLYHPLFLTTLSHISNIFPEILFIITRTKISSEHHHKKYIFNKMTILNQLQQIMPKTYAAKFWCWATVINLHVFTTLYLRKLALVAEHENQTKIGYFHEDFEKTNTKPLSPSNYSNFLDSTQPASWEVVKTGNC